MADSSIIDTLILDRTAQDVANLTEKGYYNATDINRVGEAMLYVAGRFRAYGYHAPVSPKTDWTRMDFPTEGRMAHYLDDLRTLRSVFAVLSATPPAPAYTDSLTWKEANDIERILVDVDHLITNMKAAWYYSGELYAGEV